MFILAAFALFAAGSASLRLNVAAERLEPEAMEAAKQEDETVSQMKP